MKKTISDRKALRIVDANINRLTEGLRVCEDVARFILSDAGATRRFKSLRHRIFEAAERIGADRKLLARFRNSEGDIGKASAAGEKKRDSVLDIFMANIKRGEESMRVLEEFAKLLNPFAADRFKKMRFELYSLEKGVIEKLQHLCNT
jgi:thiamine-phosphate pyrophosphorylase